MCDICRQEPCANRCPNAEVTIYDTCTECGSDIYIGDTLWLINDKAYCKNCIDDLKMEADYEI